MKLVSMRLKAVVCELAMLPEMFSSAKDCARMPGHRGGESAENTHDSLHAYERPPKRRAQIGRTIASRRKPRATEKC